MSGCREVGYGVGKGGGEGIVGSRLEVGGKSGNMMFDEGNIDEVIEGVELGIVLKEGEVCSGGCRLVVE